jgi:hypothetical protein
MGQRMVIELSSDEAAASLAGVLEPLLGNATVEGSHVVLLADRSADRFAVDALDAVKAWVDAGGAESVQVLLEGRTYTLSSTRASELSA